MKQAQPIVKNDAMTVSHADYPVLRPERPVQTAHWDTESNPVTVEKYSFGSRPTLVFFWDGKKVHWITDERPRQEIARIIDNNL